MKINKIKKIFSVIILILMLFNIVQPVLAASGSGVWTGGQYASGMKTTDNQNGTTGIICITSPTMTYGTIAWVLGFSMLLESIANIANWDERKSLGFANGWDLVGSIISLILSIILIFSNVLQATVDLFILIIAAVWLIVIGIVRIVTSFKVKKLHYELNTLILGKHWYIALILGIIMILAGILCLMHPVVLAITIGVYIGIEIIIAGIELITYAV